VDVPEDVIARSEATKQSSFSFFVQQAGLLRFARKDGMNDWLAFSKIESAVKFAS
jgi:hypothetical protein